MIGLQVEVYHEDRACTDLVLLQNCTFSCSDSHTVIVLPVQVFGFLVSGVFGLNTFLAVRRYRRGNGSQGAAQANDYIRARTASRGEMEARSEIA